MNFLRELYHHYVASSSPDMATSYADAIFYVWLSTLIGARIRLRDVPGELSAYPCIWLVLVGEPATYKSSALRLLLASLREIEDRVDENGDPFPFAISLHGSPEGLLQILAATPKGEGVLIYRDEFVSLLRAAKRDSYASAWRDMLLELYSPFTPITRVLRKERIVVENAFTPFISTITPVNLTAYAGMEELRTGFLTRFIPLSPSAPISAKATDIPEKYLEHLYGFARDLRSAFPHPSFITLNDAAETLLVEKLSEVEVKRKKLDSELHPWLLRASELLPKCAALLAAASFRHIVTEEDVEEAFFFVEIAWKGVEQIYSSLGGYEVWRELYRLLEWLAPRGEATRSEIIRKFRWTTRMLNEVEMLAQQSGYIYIENGKTQGRPVQLWRLLELPEEFFPS